MTTQERYEAMSLERLQAERDALLVRVDRWLTLGYMASAKVANLKLDAVEALILRAVQ